MSPMGSSKQADLARYDGSDRPARLLVTILSPQIYAAYISCPILPTGLPGIYTFGLQKRKHEAHDTPTLSPAATFRTHHHTKTTNLR